MSRYSFEVVGTHQGATVIYTNPSRAPPIRTDVDLDGFLTCLSPYATRPWIWVFDCKGMGLSHSLGLGHVRRLAATLQNVHGRSLQCVWVINIHPWLKQMLSMFPGEKVRVLSAGGIELLTEFNKVGYPSSVTDGVIARLTSS